MTAVEPGPDQTLDSVLERIGHAVDTQGLERAWYEGLRCHRDRVDRDRVLVAAGARLGVFDSAESEPLRRSWLRQLAEEVRLRGDHPLGEALAAMAMSEFREAFALAGDDLAEFRVAADGGQDIHDCARHSPASTMRIRDLGRVAERLRDHGVTALVASEDVELSIEFAKALTPRRPLVATVPALMRVSRDALLNWDAADREMPRLIRSLIAETEPSAEWIGMPAGTAVTQSGWDGRVRCVEGNRFVPAGPSVWELSAQKRNSDGKARSDYDGRVASTPRADRVDMTYVAAICAPWTKAAAFAQEKSQSGDFRSVSALNADALEAWLECAPVTTVWLRTQMGEPDGVGLLSGWWAKWLDATTVPLDAGVVLAGRGLQAEALRDRCQRQGGVITIGGNVHRDEILAFTAASLVSSESSVASPIDALYIDDRAEARRLLSVEARSTSGRSSQFAPAMTVVVPSTEFAEDLPAGSQHRMIVPVPGSSQADITLEAVDSEIIAQRMQAAGSDLRTAHERGSLARMSVLALMRHLAVDPALHRPAWATGSVDRTLRLSLLLGGWSEGREGDREIVERFVGNPYDAVTEMLSQLDPGEAPMIATGDLWHEVSPADTWTLLGDQFSRNDITTFGEVAHEVLTEPDPLQELAGTELLRAQVEGVRAKYSPQLKRGVATTLALLGSNPPVLRGDASPALDAAPGIVSRVLRAAAKDPTPKTWAAVSEVLSLLAEAAPEGVLEGLRSCLSKQHAFVGAMFADGDSDEFGFSPTSPHFRVLDALEALAWAPEYLMAVVDVLGELAEIDPGGRYSNRPAESLASIMCPWLPYTSASTDDRLTAIQMLRRSRRTVTWPLMLSMLPTRRGIQMPDRRPQFRNWRQGDLAVTQREYARTVLSVAEMVLEDVGEDPARWVNLIEHFANLPEEIRTRATTTLDRLAIEGTDEGFKATVWPKLHAEVSRHRQYSDAQWALPESELAPFDHVLDLLRPVEPAVSYGDRFSSGLMYIDGVGARDGWDAFQAALQPKQAEAVEAILAGGGVEAVLEFAESVDQPRRVGSALARCDSTQDDVVLAAMDAAPEAVTQAALGYFGHRFDALGWEGINQLLESHDLTPQVAADLLRTPPPVQSPWTRVGALGAEVAAHYWARVSYYDLGIPEEMSQLLEVSRRLREAERTGLVRTLLVARCDAHASQPDFAEEAAACLEQWIQNPPADTDHTGMTAWELTTLLKVLDRHREHLGPGRVAGIEWQYHPILHHDPEYRAPNLYREMARDPDLFVWLVELAFKPANASPGDQPPKNEAQRLMAGTAFDVLQSWPASNFAPGLDDEGSLNAEWLNDWINRARERLAEIDRADIGDTMIGTALAASPADPNEAWPGSAVRDLLERLKSDDVDSGLFTAVRNERDSTSRSPTEGGDQERHLAASYRELSRRFSNWPRTAAIFTGLARSYEHEAAIHDREAEARRRGLPW